MRFVFLVALAVLGLSGQALAWGDDGHRIICEIAFEKVKPSTRAQIIKLIQADGQFDSFPDSCVWPDHPSRRTPEHFVNLPRDASGVSTVCGEAVECVVRAIGIDFGVLASRSASQSAKAASLKYLGHWVGDIHQPLHVAFKDDRGGNDIPVSGECDGNLHLTWDVCLVVRALGKDARAAAAELLASTGPAQTEAWTRRSDPREWANESFRITESAKTKYCVRQGGSCNKPPGRVTVDAAYLKDNAPIVREQLLKAGIRLAHLLDMAFSH